MTGGKSTCWRRRLALLLAALLTGLTLATAGMAQQQPPPPPMAFDKDELAIRTASGVVKFKVELALTEAQKSRGLMFREKLEPYTGMLFDFGDPQMVSMWMMNTLIPLDMVFIAADGKIISIAAMTKPLSTDTISSGGLAKGVLEIAGGTALLLGIKPGDVVLYPVFGTKP